MQDLRDAVISEHRELADRGVDREQWVRACVPRVESCPRLRNKDLGSLPEAD